MALKYPERKRYPPRRRPTPEEFAARFWSHVDKSGGPDACWPWMAAKQKSGHGHLGFEGKTLGAHRVAWELINGPLQPGQLVRHKVCDNPPCCNPAHLLAGTPLDNTHDAIEKGRNAAGERHGNAKLTYELVETIRREYVKGVNGSYRLARKYGVSQTTILDVVNQTKYKPQSSNTQNTQL